MDTKTLFDMIAYHADETGFLAEEGLLVLGTRLKDEEMAYTDLSLYGDIEAIAATLIQVMRLNEDFLRLVTLAVQAANDPELEN